MSQDIRDFVPASCDLFAVGEPTHQEPAFGWVRNELLVQLVDHGFRSVALETDRVAALAVDDFVQHGIGTLDAAMRDGFSHGFGALAPNRALVAWLHDHNEDRHEDDRVAFHGFDAATETMSAPSPRRYLEHARDYLALDLDVASLAGDDERWSREEAVMDLTMSVGDTEDAVALRTIADDMRVLLHARAPGLIAATSRKAWFTADTHLTAGIGLLRYHRQVARPLESSARVAALLGVRDVLMARNLLDLRVVEAGRGATLVCAHNHHLQRNPSRWRLADMDCTWSGAGAIVASLVGERYAVVAGSLGRSDGLGLPEPEPDTYEGLLQRQVATWALMKPAAVAPANVRDDTTPRQGYFPLNEATLDAVDAVLHVNAGFQRRSPCPSARGPGGRWRPPG